MENLSQKLVNVVFCVVSESVTLLTWSVGVCNPAENTKKHLLALDLFVVQESLLSGCTCDRVRCRPGV